MLVAVFKSGANKFRDRRQNGAGHCKVDFEFEAAFLFKANETVRKNGVGHLAIAFAYRAKHNAPPRNDEHLRRQSKVNF